MNNVKPTGNWLLFMGIVMVILGFIGLSMEVALTITSLMFFGFLVLFAGVAQFIHLFTDHGLSHKAWDFIIALLYAAAGIVMILYPAASAVWFTVVIAAILVIAGVVRLLIAVEMKNTTIKGWGWVLLSGLISILLGGMIFSAWPVSGLWVIGMFIAIELLLQGFTLISIALAVKSAK